MSDSNVIKLDDAPKLKSAMNKDYRILLREYLKQFILIPTKLTSDAR
jgi:hypothetical protein